MINTWHISRRMSMRVYQKSWFSFSCRYFKNIFSSPSSFSFSFSPTPNFCILKSNYLFEKKRNILETCVFNRLEIRNSVSMSHPKNFVCDNISFFFVQTITTWVSFFFFLIVQGPLLEDHPFYLIWSPDEKVFF